MYKRQVRTVAPYVAGAAGLRYRQFAPYSLVAATVWASAEAGAGYAAGASYGRLAARLGGTGAFGVSAGVLLLGTVTVLAVRRRGRRSGTAREEAAVGARHREVEPVRVGAGVDAELVPARTSAACRNRVRVEHGADRVHPSAAGAMPTGCVLGDGVH